MWNPRTGHLPCCARAVAVASAGMLGLRAANDFAEASVPPVEVAQVLRPSIASSLRWFEGERLSVQTMAVLRAMERAPEHGLPTSRYEAGALRKQLSSAKTADQRTLAGSVLSEAAARYARDLADGRASPRAFGWEVPVHRIDAAEVLERLAHSPDPEGELRRLAPAYPEYTQLRGALWQLRATEERGGWPRMSPGAVLQFGSEGDRVRELRVRLRSSGDLQEPLRLDSAVPEGAVGNAGRFDEELDGVVRAFQRRHGMAGDGVVGPATLRALNVPIEARIAQVELNLERWRWLPREPPGRWVRVNVPSFEAFALEHTTSALRSAVVVGVADPKWQTPALSDLIEGVVVHPVWRVPPNIAKEELEPLLASRPEHAATVGIRAVRASDGSVRYEQQAGPRNPLGEARLVMRNRHAVYLHGTALPAAFGLPSRALSHGCIRVEQIRPLVEWLLEDEASFSEYVAALKAGRSQRLRLREPVPVLLTYFTTTVDDAGGLSFHPDVYRRDDALAKALAATHARVLQRPEGDDGAEIAVVVAEP